jgi:glycosyltransferase involved in cell wall biosynthesis
MKIAITGFRGIPANYGGFESFVEELAPRLVKKGHDVTVYCRSNNIQYDNEYYKGVRLVILPTISNKYLDTPAHSFISLLHCCSRKYDVILLLNAANSPFAFVPRLFGAKVVLNVDGIERLRKKWNWVGKLYYRLGEWCATKMPDQIVSDAYVIEKYYREKYNASSVMIPYGAYVEKVDTRGTLDSLGVRPQEYLLYVSRLEPENNADVVIKAFRKVKTDKSLVIVGDAPYADKYKEMLKDIAKDDKRIIFAGAVYGKGYKELQSNAYCYIQATEVGGTHPALIEAMGMSNCVIANGTQENIEVLGDGGLIYRKNDIEDLKNKIQEVIDNPGKCSEYARVARNKIMQSYTWEAVTDNYEKLFKECML